MNKRQIEKMNRQLEQLNRPTPQPCAECGSDYHDHWDEGVQVYPIRDGKTCRGYRHSPPAEPTPLSDSMRPYQIPPEEADISYYRPPTTEPAESEGKECPRCFVNGSVNCDIHRPSVDWKTLQLSPTVPPAETTEDAKAWAAWSVEFAKEREKRVNCYVTECGMPEDVEEFKAFLRDFSASEVPYIAQAEIERYIAEVAIQDVNRLAETTEDAKAFNQAQEEWWRKEPKHECDAMDQCSRCVVEFTIEYAAKQIERQTPAIIEGFVAEVEKEWKKDRISVHYASELFELIEETVKARQSKGEK